MIPASESLVALTITMKRIVVPPSDSSCQFAVVFRTALERQRVPGLQQRLETAEHFVPTTAGAAGFVLARDKCREFGRAREIMRDRQLRHAAPDGLHVVCQAGKALGGQLRLHQHAPRLYESRGGARFDDLAVDDDIRDAGELLHSVWDGRETRAWQNRILTGARSRT